MKSSKVDLEKELAHAIDEELRFAKDYKKELNKPIAGDANVATILANLAVMTYNLNLDNQILKKQIASLEAEIDTMKSNINEANSGISFLSNMILKYGK